jgi:hypothetical protein
MRTGGLIGGVLLIVLGFVFLLTNYGILSSEVWKLWPLILIVIGASILFRQGECMEREKGKK